jgi:hypothetical protein
MLGTTPLNVKTQMPDEVQAIIMEEFKKLPLADQLIVYAKMRHGTEFKVVSHDIFGMGKNKANKVYADFLKKVRGRYGM